MKSWTYLRDFVQQEAIYMQNEGRRQIFRFEFLESDEKHRQKEDVVRPKNVVGWRQYFLKLIHDRENERRSDSYVRDVYMYYGRGTVTLDAVDRHKIKKPHL